MGFNYNVSSLGRVEEYSSNIDCIRLYMFEACTGCLKKMVIELWSALARSLYNLQKFFFHSRKDQAFSFRVSPFL